MNKFPMLKLYKNGAYILGWLIIIGGLLISIQAARGTFSNQFQFTTFLTSFITFLIAGGSLFIVAEFISLGLKVEDHLDLMRQNEVQFYNKQNKLSQTVEAELKNITTSLNKLEMSSSSLNQSIGTLTTTEASVQALQSNNILDLPTGPRLTATTTAERPLGYREPDTKTRVYRVFKEGQSIILAGRTEDQQWVICTDGEWIKTEQLDIDGNITQLPIITQA